MLSESTVPSISSFSLSTAVTVVKLRAAGAYLKRENVLTLTLPREMRLMKFQSTITVSHAPANEPQRLRWSRKTCTSLEVSISKKHICCAAVCCYLCPQLVHGNTQTHKIQTHIASFDSPFIQDNCIICQTKVMGVGVD